MIKACFYDPQVNRTYGEMAAHYDTAALPARHRRPATALILARAFGNSPDFWLNVQRRNDLWEVMNTPKERERVERARPVKRAA